MYVAWLKAIQSLKECAIRILCRTHLKQETGAYDGQGPKENHLGKKKPCKLTEYFVQNGRQEIQENTSLQK
jgi:hypothetical protein